DATFRDNKLGGVYYLTSVHLTGAGKTEPTAGLFIEEYINGTIPFIDREKYAIIPSRTEHGACRPHACKMKEGFEFDLKQSDDRMTMHHYRSARPEWMWPAKIQKELMLKNVFKSWDRTAVEGFKRVRSPEVQQLAHAIRENVYRVKKLLNI
ncbi:hypothetical protein MAR_028665, partial [Mya arenaria]